VQYHSLQAGHHYGQYVRDAKNARKDDIASSFEEVTKQDSKCAHRCHEFPRAVRRQTTRRRRASRNSDRVEVVTGSRARPSAPGRDSATLELIPGPPLPHGDAGKTLLGLPAFTGWTD
jgi:hypothetical protein